MTTNYITVTNFVTLTTNAEQSISGLDVVGNVKALYSSEFDKLFQLTLWILGFVGIGLPILLPLYQKWLMRSELKTQLGKQMQNVQRELIGKIGDKFRDEKTAIDLHLQEKLDANEKRINKAEGNSYHLQGHRNLERQRYYQACTDFTKAAELYCLAESGQVLIRTIQFMIDEVLPHIKKTDLEHDGLSNRLDDLLKSAGKLNNNGYLSDLLKSFAAAHREAKQR
jgi:hypothetical protein